MSLSSWLFGKKKATSESDVSNDTKSSPGDEDYVLIDSNNPYRSSSMYPNLPGSSSALPYQVQTNQDRSSGIGYSLGPTVLSEVNPGIDALSVGPSNPLDDVPFKLSAVIDTRAAGWSDSEASQITYLLTRVSHLNNTAFKYDFSLEQSVISEANYDSR